MEMDFATAARDEKIGVLGVKTQKHVSLSWELVDPSCYHKIFHTFTFFFSLSFEKRLLV